MSLYELPTIDELLYARDWLMQGAPAASKDFAAKQAVHVLLKLMSALPGHLPQYAHSTPEHKEFDQQNVDISRKFHAENEHFKQALSLLREHLYDGAEPYYAMVSPTAQMLAEYEKIVIRKHRL